MSDVTALVVAHHVEIRQLFVELRRDTDTPGVRRNLVHHVVTELTGHCEAEQRTIYVAVEEALGHDEAEALRRDHDELDQLIGAVLGASDDARQRELLADLEQRARTHMAREEHDVLPRLAAKVGIKRRSSLAAAFSQTTEAYTNLVVRQRRRAV